MVLLLKNISKYLIETGYHQKLDLTARKKTELALINLATINYQKKKSLATIATAYNFYHTISMIRVGLQKALLQ